MRAWRWNARDDRVYFLVSDHIEVYEVSTGRFIENIEGVGGYEIELLPNHQIMVTAADEIILVPGDGGVARPIANPIRRWPASPCCRR